MSGGTLIALVVALLSIPGRQWTHGQTVEPPTVDSQGGTSQTAPQVRFHHVHLEVPDPAAAMSELVGKVDGTRVLLPGLGVGVRAPGYYVLFDRLDHPASPEASVREPGDLQRRAAQWLHDRGVVVEAGSAVPPPLDDAVVGHIGFATADPDRVVEMLRRAGAMPVRRSPDAALFAADGAAVEIVRDTDRPDAFWCPMHLDVRSPDARTCPVCGMDLVPIPPLRLGEYRLDVAAGPRELTLRVADPGGEPVTQFVTIHERPFHLFVISRDLESFAHVHPDAVGGAPGEFRLPIAAPLRAGPYMAIADVLPYGGTSQMLHRAFVTPGYRGGIFSPPPVLRAGPAEAVVDGIRVRIEADLPARRAGRIRFALSHAATGAPVTDLEPFLGAAAHMLIVSPDLTDAIHAHPEEQETAGPAVSFEPLMPAPGLYKLWVQFQRTGRVTTAAFVVTAR